MHINEDGHHVTETHYKTGQIESRDIWCSKKEHEIEYKEWYENGILKSFYQYLNGKPTKKETCWEHGNEKALEMWDLETRWQLQNRAWHENGVLALHFTFLKGFLLKEESFYDDESINHVKNHRKVAA